MRPRRIAALAAGLLLTAALAVVLQVSVAGALRQRLPRVTLTWVPNDADARAALAAALASSRGPEAHVAARELAVDAIRRSPISPQGLRALGVVESAPGGSAERALAIMTEAQRLSRRELQTQIWWIESYLRAGDLAAVMRQFDVALRSASGGRDALFSLLATAAADPRLAEPLKERMLSDPHWARPFMEHMIDSGLNPVRTVYFAQGFLDASKPDDLQMLDTLVQNLGALREYDLAWQVFTGFGLRARSRNGGVALLVDGGFETSSDHEPFAWVLSEEGDLWAARQQAPKGREGQVLGLVAHSGRSGEVARQLVRLGPGRYQVVATMGNVPQDAFERPELRLSCATADVKPGQVLLILKPTFSGESARQVSARFTVPPTCRFQWVAVAVAGGGQQPDVVPWVDDIRLVRASR